MCLLSLPDIHETSYLKIFIHNSNQTTQTRAQEIREPARDIHELRTLVMPKDKRDTLTYVEEVGGFVDQSTGEVPSPEPAYPDVQVDLFHSYELPAAAAIAFDADNAFGTGNVPDADGELRFKADDEIAEWFETLAKAEKSHAGRFQGALDTLEKL